MIEIGKFNKLEVLRETSVGLFLGDDGEEVLLPIRYVEEHMEVGDDVEVFIYNDSEDRLIAVTTKPKINLNEFAALEVVDVNNVGAFMDWGMIKDLLVPFREQAGRMDIGEKYLVFLYLDSRTERLVASCKLNRFLNNIHITLEEGEEVDIMVWKKSDLGYKVIINEETEGLIFHSDVFRPLEPGDQMKAYIKTIREDNKIDVVLHKQGYKQVMEPTAEKILQVIREANGFLPLHDKSDPDDIKKQLQMSKKNFKKAIGSLYKQKIINIEKNGIRLVE